MDPVTSFILVSGKVKITIHNGPAGVNQCVPVDDYIGPVTVVDVFHHLPGFDGQIFGRPADVRAAAGENLRGRSPVAGFSFYFWLPHPRMCLRVRKGQCQSVVRLGRKINIFL